MEDRIDSLRRELRRVRQGTHALLAPLDEELLHQQHHSIMSPLVWDLGHIGVFEELWILRNLAGRPAREKVLDTLYNPFDQPRWTRGRLPLLSCEEARAYLREVREEALEVLEELEPEGEDPLAREGFVFHMVAQHEAQHQETMLQTLDLLCGEEPYPPASRRRDWRVGDVVTDEERICVPEGPFLAGTGDRSRAYDNERPRHEVHAQGFAIDRFPVTVRRYSAFIADGGYSRPSLWSPEGLEWLERSGARSPQGWVRGPGGEGWRLRRFCHLLPLDLREPVQHISYYEAEAFARWAGGRLPSEMEWEKAARWDPRTGTARTYPWGEEPPSCALANVGRRDWGPAPVGAFPEGASAYGVEQMLGETYEWTSTEFDGYPGFEAFPYREYSEVFFGKGYRVLRGASWATDPVLLRTSYRNWDLPERRQIFAGLRLAWDA